MSGVRTASLALLGVLAMGTGWAHAQSSSSPPSSADPPACAAREDVLGISRIVEIDATTGPHFGDQYKEVPFLADGEVILTFDDGPMRRYTIPILDALEAQCTKATFFSVGRMAIADPETLKEVAKRGHTIASHTWSHRKLKFVTAAAGQYEIELGLSAVTAALGSPVAPFFRFPYLADTKAALDHLGSRGIATFGIDVDSRDFRTHNPGIVLRNVLDQLDKKRKGIILFHDIQPATAGALASLLAELKTHGFKIVHMVAKGTAVTLPEYDAIAQKVLQAKEIAAKANPLAKRTVTWPVATTTKGAATATDGTAPDGLPWTDLTREAAAAPKPARRSARKPDPSPADEPWQLKSFGN
jgi:peptidoglycan/xylan/chitin deacetylase (PgdA/CDA1 family)